MLESSALTMTSEIKSSTVFKSVSDDQQVILDAIKALHCPDGFDVDITWGNGAFWKGRDDAPVLRFDIEPLDDSVIQSDSKSLPLESSSVDSVVYDPPFLTYVRQGRSGNGSMIMSKRFGGYWRYDELEDDYRKTFFECARILKNKGVLVVKCQDIIHNHKMHATHINVTSWAGEAGFRLKDLFVLSGGGKLPAPNRSGTQKHARVSHSYFMVLALDKR